MAVSLPTPEQWLALNARLTAVEEQLNTVSSAPTFNSGDTAWVMTSTALVLLMSLPGLALFYGGQSQAKNVLSTIMQVVRKELPNVLVLACARFQHPSGFRISP